MLVFQNLQDFHINILEIRKYLLNAVLNVMFIELLYKLRLNEKTVIIDMATFPSKNCSFM